MIASEFCTVLSRWAMTNTVRPSSARPCPLDNRFGAGIDRRLVASSSIITGGSATAALAMESSCRCPWDRLPVAGKGRIVALGQAGDEIMRARQLCRGNAFFVERVQPAVADVFHNCSGKQVGVLQDHAKTAAQIGLFNFVDVDSVVTDFAVRNVVKPVDQVGNRCLSRARGAHERDFLAGFGVEGYAVQDRLSGA